MKFEIKELDKKQKNVIEINLEKDCLEKLKKEASEESVIAINFEALNLGEKLYGNSKKESTEIQKQNCKHVLKFCRICKRAVKILKRKKIGFSGCFYVENLNQKKNNNDLMIVGLLDIRFNVNIFKHLEVAMDYACDYLDAENEINNMCDFKENQCVCHREKGKKGKTGCCPSFCKYTQAGVCKMKNLSCKIFMCNFLEDRGYYFSPNGVPVMKAHMTLFERLASFGMLCKSKKKTVVNMWLIRALTMLYALVLVGVVLLIAL